MATTESNQSGEGSIFRTGQNCWKLERAEKFSLIVDAADYFRVLRDVLVDSKREVLLIGWDFDFEIEMLPGDSDDAGNAPDGLPNQLGPFIEAVVDQAPELHIYMLKWNGAALVAPGRLVPSLAMYVFGNDRIHFAFDGHHPFGACHHQKIVVADGSLAFCGGIDVTEERWDTSAHLPDDPRRKRKDGSLSEPWHDVTTVTTGPVAAALGDLSRIRWQRATGETLDKPENMSDLAWPAALHIDGRQIEVAIARTEPPYNGAPLVHEIEQLALDSIKAAKQAIYIESQYFAAEKICAALESRLSAPDGPEVVVINPDSAPSPLEDDAMHVLRCRIIKRLQEADHDDRFRIYHPVNEAGAPIYVHAKVMIVDDQILRVGSSNMNDRSMGFDTECDIALDSACDLVTTFRARLLGEHLDVPTETFNEVLEQEGSLISAIEKLNSADGRRLCAIERKAKGARGARGEFLADTRLLDPRYSPGQETSAGQGLRPRHVTLALGGVLMAALAWGAVTLL